MLAEEVAVDAATCCANSHRLFRIAQHSCSFEYLLTPRQQSNRNTEKNTRKLLHMAGHPSTSQCIFQEGMKTPGRLQQQLAHTTCCQDDPYYYRLLLYYRSACQVLTCPRKNICPGIQSPRSSPINFCLSLTPRSTRSQPGRRRIRKGERRWSRPSNKIF